MKQNNPALWKDNLPKTNENSNKYSRGSVLIYGAGLESCGATKLAAFAAARAGSGYTVVACDDASLLSYQSSFLSIMAKPIKKEKDFINFINQKKITCVVLGPGNGTGEDLYKITLEILKNKILKTIIDADAISVFKDNPKDLLDSLHENCILTPHEGEFARIFSFDGNRENSIKNAIKSCNATIVLKGSKTLIANKNEIIINENAPATLATAGSGDVLSGIIAGLACQHISAFDAACAGVYIQSQCANVLKHNIIAEDLITKIPEVIFKLQN
jgi:hydroxyethylthiazole kinase-like uncharacterized protein yjeF